MQVGSSSGNMRLSRKLVKATLKEKKLWEEAKKLSQAWHSMMSCGEVKSAEASKVLSFSV